MKKHILDLVEQARLLQYPYKNQPAATPVEISRLEEASKQQLGYNVPPFYGEFLQVCDGMACNGIQLYGSTTKPIVGLEKRASLLEGLVEANMLWRAGEEGAHNADYVYFAESGDYLYCHYLPDDRYQIVDRVTLEPIYEPAVFDTAEELLTQILNHMLDRYGVEDEA